MKSVTFAALRLLSDGEFHSGNQLARALDLSRAGVWQALKGVERFGVTLYRVRGRGYRLTQPIDWLDLDAIKPSLDSMAGAFDIKLYDELDSTNALLMRQTHEGAATRTCIVAEFQHGGRGRRGRRWLGNLGGVLTYSVLWRFTQGTGFISGLSLAVGVAIADTLRKVYGIDSIQLKWPNDIICREEKLAGILVELSGDLLGPCAAVIGVGINVRLSDDIKSQIDQPSTDLCTIMSKAVNRSLLLGCMLTHLGAVLERFEKTGLDSVQALWQQYHAYQGRAVQLILPNGEKIHGTVTGVAQDGALLLRTPAGIERFQSGELSMRPV
jgi:BirA family biotin operon repressor/biotin-[acetyl-CoA-carboxylase] ligase